jgi:hypothetical protein
MDFKKIRTYPIASRRNKFSIDQMIPPGSNVPFHSNELETVAKQIKKAKALGRPIIVMMGGAVIKDGCSLLLIDLMEKGFINFLAMNGSVSIHDFEIALIGKTSEDVQSSLKDGSFGMADETGRYMNSAINKGYAENLGYGESIALEIERLDLPYKNSSIIYRAHKLGIGLSVHVAIGGDIIHQHPDCSGAALGATSFEDFRKFTEAVAGLDEGVALNIGSAVIMPEVFLKALAISINLGHGYTSFTVANFDFLEMYRPRTRVIEWPKTLGATGYNISGRHNQTIPKLHSLLVPLSF